LQKLLYELVVALHVIVRFQVFYAETTDWLKLRHCERTTANTQLG